LPDARDLRPESDVVHRLLARPRRRAAPRTTRPAQVDWSEYLVAPDGAAAVHDDHPPLAVARACATMAQYFHRRATGEVLDPSSAFLHHVSQRLAGRSVDEPAEFRSTLKALARFGLPPARLWKPANSPSFSAQLDPLLFGFARDWADVMYVRLEAPEATGALVLRQVKAFLAAGYAAVFGSVLPDLLGDDGQISFPTRQESATVGQALLAVGYNDQHRWRSEKGALRVRGFFSSTWGEAGCGWLPYRYVEQRLAVDFWTLVRPGWIASGEFEQPVGI
jgi:C1A family cysteine protease